MGNSIDYVGQMKGKRFIKTHLPWHLLPLNLSTSTDVKMIYTARNPKDLAVSYYHYCCLVHQINCTMEEFLELFLADKWAYGACGRHMIEFWKRRNQSNILFVKYEDMKKDLPSIIKQCADFLKIERKLTPEDIERLCEHLKFEKMEKNPSVNLEPIIFKENDSKEQLDQELYGKVKFIRKGQVGDWKNFLSPENNAKFDKWIEENFAGTGLEFDYN